MVLAAFLFMHRMSEVTNVRAVTRELQRERREGNEDVVLAGPDIPDGVYVYEIRGAFFFGAADAFRDTIGQVAKTPKVLIIRMRDVSFLDATGLRALRDVVRRSRRERTLVLIAELHAQPRIVMQRSPLWSELGEESVLPTLEDALDRSRDFLASRAPTPPMGSPVMK